MTAEERLDELAAEVLRDRRPMTEAQIVPAIFRVPGSRRMPPAFATSSCPRPAASVESGHAFTSFGAAVDGLLVEAGSAGDPGNAGAPVPAWPYRPTLSGAAAAPLKFRGDEPPTNATGVYSTTDRGATGSGSSTMSSAVAWLIQY